MNCSRLLAIPFAIATCFSFAGGRVTGNGGDRIVCNGQVVMLDFALMPSADKEQLVTVIDTTASLERIQALLAKHSALLSEQFALYRSLISNQTRRWEPYIWEMSTLSLINVPDEALTRSLAKDCDPNSLTQIVVRTENELGDVRFEVDSESAAGVLADPLQASLLYVHEWLWDFVGDAAQVRRINAFLHGKTASEIDTEQFLKSLQVLGLSSEVITGTGSWTQGAVGKRVWKVLVEQRDKKVSVKAKSQLRVLFADAESKLDKLQRKGRHDQRASSLSIDEASADWKGEFLNALSSFIATQEKEGVFSTESASVYLIVSAFDRRMSFESARDALKVLNLMVAEPVH
jgi:hypothetical protein